MKALQLCLNRSDFFRNLALVSLLLCAYSSTFAQINPLPPPRNLTAQFIPEPMRSVDLRWQGTPGASFYKVFRSIGDTVGFDWIGVATSLSYQDRQTYIFTTYYYFVTAVAFNDTLMFESPRSNIASATVGSSRPQGVIRGAVVSDANGSPIPNVRIRFYRLDGQMYWLPGTYTNATGRYEALLDTGSYFIKAEPPLNHPGHPNYRPEWYNNAPSPSTATPVLVSSASTFDANFGLASTTPEQIARIEGLVRNELGVPLVNASVAIMRTIQQMYRMAAATGVEPGIGKEARMIPGVGYCRGVLWSGQTDSRGKFVAFVPADSNYIALAAKPGFLPEYFDNSSDPTLASIIHADSVVTGINFSLAAVPEQQNRVRGVVQDSSGVPVPSRVILFPRPRNNNSPGSSGRFVHTDSTGFYSIDRLTASAYIVLAVPFSSYAPGFYKQGRYGITNWEMADSIVVAGTVENVNVGLVSVSSSGLVRVGGNVNTSQGQSVNGGQVYAFASNGMCVGSAVTDATGAYTFDNVPPGQTIVSADRTGFSASQTALFIPNNTYTVQLPTISLGPLLSTGVREDGERPISIELSQNYPNPFNPRTDFGFRISDLGFVSVKVFDLIGREVATLANEQFKPGTYRISWDAHDFPSGVYFMRLSVGGLTQVRKLVLMK